MAKKQDFDVVIVGDGRSRHARAPLSAAARFIDVSTATS
jgi:hypothetical protein